MVLAQHTNGTKIKNYNLFKNVSIINTVRATAQLRPYREIRRPVPVGKELNYNSTPPSGTNSINAKYFDRSTKCPCLEKWIKLYTL
jgi:hypothetical protein